ncbi:MAG: F0F1 ATP synthase subunit delta [Candidatus Alcyoniella australis]|nr:F0F1 ATP synthase subunit delta [Candidatus Alcyoniella australis]
MKGTIVARRYARALFNIGLDDGRIEDYRQALNELAALFREDHRISEVLDNPMYDKSFRDQLIERLVSSINPEWTEFANFLRLLYDKRRLGIIGDIADSFQELADREAGRLAADVISATALDDKTVERIGEALSTKLGNKVQVKVAIDASLLAGFRAQIGSLVIDGSVAGQINRLRDTLTQGNS